MFIIIAAVRMSKAIPIGIVTFSISSLLPYLLERDIPMKLPKALVDPKNIILPRRLEGESPPKPASFIIEGP